MPLSKLGVPIPTQNPFSNRDKFTFGGKGRDKVLRGVKKETLSKMVEAQDIYGKTVDLFSGLRKNASKGSQHRPEHGARALDAWVPGGPAEEAKMIAAGQMAGFRGIGAYGDGELHFDSRHQYMPWGPNRSKTSIHRLDPRIQRALINPDKTPRTSAQLEPTMKYGGPDAAPQVITAQAQYQQPQAIMPTPPDSIQVTDLPPPGSVQDDFRQPPTRTIPSLNEVASVEAYSPPVVMPTTAPTTKQEKQKNKSVKAKILKALMSRKYNVAGMNRFRTGQEVNYRESR
jgi:hypothetical protein